ncbi:MAG: hypothetical protein U5N58_03880 [Actinomycetota bacterium]|nr:hypothetical protein [Actinomycetota bacterium]
MNWIFLSIIIGGLISLVATPVFIKFQKSKQIGQSIRVDGPKSHSTKVGTPTMGGMVFVLSSLIAFAAVSRYKVFQVPGVQL